MKVRETSIKGVVYYVADLGMRSGRPALHQDAGKVVLMLGNSPAILLKHYRELVTPEECEAFWAILPKRTPAKSR